jgi:hypothetical protein
MSKVEKATIEKVRSIPDWLRDTFSQERLAAEKITDPVKRRAAIVDVEMREDKILGEFREGGNDA